MYTIIDLVSCWKGLLFKHEVNTTLEACNDTHVQCIDNCSLISHLYFFILCFHSWVIYTSLALDTKRLSGSLLEKVPDMSHMVKRETLLAPLRKMFKNH